LIDSHVHLNREDFAADRESVMAAARQAGVTGFLNVGYDPDSSHESVALAAEHHDVWATVGIHPHDALLVADAEGRITAEGRRRLDELAGLAAHDKVVAWGEIGLDFFRDLSPRPAQYAALTAQLELADRLELPVIFHIRDAWAETLAHVDTVGVPAAGGVLHSFSGDESAVGWARERGMLLGIGGPVTYRKSTLPSQVVAAGCDMLLLETDAPWLPPVPHRGQRNESAYLQFTRARVAELLDLTVDEVSARTSASFHRVFGTRPRGSS